MLNTNRLKTIIIGGVVFLVLVVFLVVTFFPKPSKNNTPPNNFSVGREKPTTQGFEIISFTPEQQEAALFPDQPIEILFSQSVSKEGVKIEVQPPVEYYFTQGEEKNKLVLYPKTIWKNGETKITILTETISYSGTHLNTPRYYTFRTALPSSPAHQGAY